MEKNCFMIDHRWNGSNHSKPDPGKVSQVKDVVKLCWGGHHLGFGRVPQHSRYWDQLFRQNANILWEAAAEKKIAVRINIKIILT
jgi:hypothetical protein